MRVLVLGGTWFLGRRVVEHARGDEALVVHRGRGEPSDSVPVRHLRTDRRELARRAGEIADLAPHAVIDSCALTAADVDAVLPAPTIL